MQRKDIVKDSVRLHMQYYDGVSSELDHFHVPPAQTSIDVGQWVEHQPVAFLELGGPIEFLLHESGDACLDLASNDLFVQAKVTKGNGTALDAGNAVGPNN